MNSTTIKASIANWGAIRSDKEQVIRYLGQGDFFTLDVPTYPIVSPSIHAYPGIYNGILYFFLIPSEYDKEQYSDTIDEYTTICKVVGLLGGEQDRITDLEAKKRISAWKRNYKTWATDQIASPIGIFMAFSIPASDFECVCPQVNFGLKVKPAMPGGFQADLIITNINGQQVFYDDFVTPVPPFSATIVPESFYLLS